MGKIFSLIFVFLVVLSMTACVQNRAKEPETAEDIETPPAFDFDTKTVTLNSRYEMPLNGLGTYSLHGEECISSVKTALSNSRRSLYPRSILLFFR